EGEGVARVWGWSSGGIGSLSRDWECRGRIVVACGAPGEAEKQHSMGSDRVTIITDREVATTSSSGPSDMTNPTTSIADLVISGATIVSDTASFPAAVAIKDGQIMAIGEYRAMSTARETFDATGLHLLPGAIDVHVHFREPGYTHKEDWQTGTAAAAMGGVTTVFEMPNVDPPTGTPEALALKQEAAKKAHVDYGLYGLLAEDNIDQLE